MAYLFTHFIGEQPQGEQIYFSLSKDGLHWKDLHDGKPVICSEVGECGLRDPFLIRKADGSGFVIIATDLCIANGRGWDAAVKTGSKNLAVMESKDLIHWSKPVLVEVSVPEAGCTWAPEAIYDRQQDNYLVFWASMVQLDGDKEPKQRIYAARTKDFHEFTKAQVYLEKDNHVIDSTMVYDDGVYYRFSKDETTKNIKTDTAPDLNKESFTDRPVPNLEAIYGVEGPEIYYLEDQKKWCLIIDRFASHKGYLPLVCDSLKTMDFKPLDESKGWERLCKTLQSKRTPLACTIHSLSTMPVASALWWTSRAARATRPWTTLCASWSGWSTAPVRTPRARPATAWASCCRSATSSSPRSPRS